MEDLWLNYLKEEKMEFKYDIIVVGGGHAGCEAAHIAAVMGAKNFVDYNGYDKACANVM